MHTHKHVRPATLFAALSSGAGLIGGLFLALGFLTPFVLAALIAQPIAIIALAHWSKGFFNTNGGTEFPPALAAMVTALAATGPGRASLDAALGIPFAPNVRLELFLLGILGGVIALAISRLAVRSAVRAARQLGRSPLIRPGRWVRPPASLARPRFHQAHVWHTRAWTWPKNGTICRLNDAPRRIYGECAPDKDIQVQERRPAAPAD